LVDLHVDGRIILKRYRNGCVCLCTVRLNRFEDPVLRDMVKRLTFVKLRGLLKSGSRICAFVIRVREKIWEYNKAVHQLFIDFKKAYDSVRREVLYNILTEFGIPKKLIRLIKMCLIPAAKPASSCCWEPTPL
jgi:hypothetical protein